MGRLAEDKIEELRARADLVEVIGAHVRLRRAGRNFVGLCPFHNEKTPSFSVNPERGFYHCFGCGAGGTVFNFVMKVEGLTFPEAVRSLARRYGVSIPESGADGPGAGERDAMIRANEVAAQFFAHVLWRTEDGAVAREYLTRRGITGETARAFMLGYAPARPASLTAALERRGLGAAGTRLGLVKQTEGGARDMFFARLMFPIRDSQGRVFAFGGRVLDQRLPKYINSTESPLYSKTRSLYGLYEARAAIAAADRAILVEGYIDTIAMWQAGFKEVVASLGTALTVEQLRLLGRYTRNVLACFDGDEAGRKASLRALECFLQAGIVGRGIFIPAGFDPDTLVKERGAQAMAELAGSAELLVDYFMREQAAAAQGTLEGRARAAQRVAATLRLVGDAFEFDLLARKAADLLGVSEAVLREQARRPAPGGQKRRPLDGARDEPSAGGASQLDAGGRAEIGLLAIALLSPETRPALRGATVPELFEDSTVAALFAEVCEAAEGQAELEVSVAQRLSERQRGILSELAVGPLMEQHEQGLRLAQDYLGALERRRRARRIEKHRHDAALRPAEAVAQAQAVIELRRGTRQER